MKIPTDEEIRTKAAELDLLDEDGNVPPQQRGVVAKLLVEAAGAPTEPQVPEALLLSRSITRVDGGYITVDVHLHTGEPR